MSNIIPQPNGSPFDSIRKVDEQGREYWSARELQGLLGYTEWRKFEDSIERAMIACENSRQSASDHFVTSDKMVQLGSGSQRSVKDYHLTRYGCYMVAMNGDPRKKEVSDAQTYFAVQTRKAELAQKQQQLPVYFNKQTQDRCEKNAELLPEGYWCVENEMVSQALVLQSLQKELHHWCLPSGSGGKKWIQHLREIQHPLLDEKSKKSKAALWVPNLPNRIKIMVYPYALLPYFRKWLRVEYAEYYDTKYAPPRMKDTDEKQIEP